MARWCSHAIVITWLLTWLLPWTNPEMALADGWERIETLTVAGGTVDALAMTETSPRAFYALVATPSGERHLFRAGEDLAWRRVYVFPTWQRGLAVGADAPDVVYVGGDDVLRRSIDGGLSWTDVFTVGQVVAAPGAGLVYAGGIVEGHAACQPGQGLAVLGRSQDGGDRWQVSPIGCGTELTAIAVQPTDSNTLLVGLRDDEAKRGYVARSEDGGQTWALVDFHPSAIEYVKDLAFDPAQPDRAYLASENGLLRSTDGGETWGGVPDPGPPYRALEVAVDAAGVVYAADRTPGPDPAYLYRSEDGGETWWRAVAPLPAACTNLLADPVEPGRLYAGFWEYGVFSSISAGGDWRERNDGWRCSLRSVISPSTLRVPRSSTRRSDRPGAGSIAATTAA